MGNYRNSKGNHTYAPMIIKTLSERATKFRRLAALPSWDAPAGSELIEDFLKHVLGPDATTTKSLSGDFTMEKIIELEDIIKESRLEKEEMSRNKTAETLTLEEGKSVGVGIWEANQTLLLKICRVPQIRECYYKILD